MKHEPLKKYRIECRAIMKQDLVVTGDKIEKIQKDWEKKFEGRKDFSVYFMINEIKEKK